MAKTSFEHLEFELKALREKVDRVDRFLSQVQISDRGTLFLELREIMASDED